MSTHAKITNIFHISHILSEKKIKVCLSTILVPKDFTQYEQGKFYITLAPKCFYLFCTWVPNLFRAYGGNVLT